MAVVEDQRFFGIVVIAFPHHDQPGVAIAAVGAGRARRAGAVREIGLQVGLEVGDGLTIEVFQMPDDICGGQVRGVLGFCWLVHGHVYHGPEASANRALMTSG